MNNRLLDLSKADNYGTILRLAFPAMIGMSLHNIMLIMDTFWVGKLGKEQVAAVAMSGSILWVLMSFVPLISAGTMAMVARAVGRGDIEDASGTGITSLFLGLMLGFALGVPGFLASSSIFRLYGVEEAVCHWGDIYLSVIFIGLPLFFFNMVATTFFQASGDTVSPMIVLAIENALNIILDPILMFGLIGFPAMGVAGAAAATVIVNILAVIAFVVLMLKKRIVSFSSFKIKKEIVTRIFSIGWPASLQALARPLSGTILFWVVAFYGTAAVAGFGIGMRSLSFMFIYLFGFNIATSTLVGQFLGAESREKAQKVVRRSLILGFAMQGIFSLFFGIFAFHVVNIFNDSPDVVAFGTGYLQVIVIGMFLGIPSFSFGGAFQGAGDTKPPMIFSLLGNWVLKIPVAVFTTFVLGWSIGGIWWAINLSIIFESVALAIWYRRGRWAERKI